MSNGADKFLSGYDILSIPDNLLPMICLSDHMNSFLGWGIKHHTKGYYHHAFWVYKRENVDGRRVLMAASQESMYKKYPMRDYLSGKYRLKLIYNPDWSAGTRQVIRDSIASDLNQGFIKNHYDWLGTFVGQFTGLRWIQLPYEKFCSERVGDGIRLVDKNMYIKKPSPADINRYTKKNNPPYKVYGRYVPD